MRCDGNEGTVKRGTRQKRAENAEIADDTPIFAVYCDKNHQTGASRSKSAYNVRLYYPFVLQAKRIMNNRIKSALVHLYKWLGSKRPDHRIY
ncbi:MAG: hypothetical protein H6R04_1940 [Burkholderiaceae bacterium]|nr:hypothetical protein [Burkholderiaceae bacterium]